MERHGRRRIESGPLRCLVSIPGSEPPVPAGWPLLCFLHGYDEGAPRPIEEALTRHGPLSATASPMAAAEFVIVAPQLPARGDLWHRYADAVEEVARRVREDHPVDPSRSALTGFSFGGNGVLDLALAQPEMWRALWPVDPTRVPPSDPGLPIWFSSGEISRRAEAGFIGLLRLERERPGGIEPSDRVYEDRGQDHVGTAASAYADDRNYRWLLARMAPEA